MKESQSLDTFPIELSQSWASFLGCRELPFGTSICRNYVFHPNGGVEVYNPSQFSRQFGMVQHIPLPFCSSINFDQFSRVSVTSDIEIKKLTLEFQQFRDYFRFTSFPSTPVMSKIFEQWWSNLWSIIYPSSAADVLAVLAPSLAIESPKATSKTGKSLLPPSLYNLLPYM